MLKNGDRKDQSDVPKLKSGSQEGLLDMMGDNREQKTHMEQPLEHKVKHVKFNHQWRPALWHKLARKWLREHPFCPLCTVPASLRLQDQRHPKQTQLIIQSGAWFLSY